MRSVSWTARARREFEAALAYIAKDSPSNAQLVRDRILNTLRNIEAFSLGLPGPKGHLKLYIPKTSYFVVFDRTPKDDGIAILAFVHGSRDWERIDWDRMDED
ncbi:MAG: type II toxin-antitoxin system RelE/ParE family toxin [Rhizobiales bacterium]|nr:type II toxin-antitoxin system RelE/ParE family toxin [Hyphomicrobiales bacterium]